MDINSESIVQVSINHKLFIVCGPSCAGKTTLAEYLREKFGFLHIEASDYMRLSFYERNNTEAPFDIGDYAAKLLKEKPEIVAEQIIRSLQLLVATPVIITGFRSPLEIDWFCDHYSGNLSIEIVYVDAEQEARYQRSVNRRRDGEAANKQEFLFRDKQQATMGLTDVQVRYCKNIITNNDTTENYFSIFELRYK